MRLHLVIAHKVDLFSFLLFDLGRPFMRAPISLFIIILETTLPFRRQPMHCISLCVKSMYQVYVSGLCIRSVFCLYLMAPQYIWWRLTSLFKREAPPFFVPGGWPENGIFWMPYCDCAGPSVAPTHSCVYDVYDLLWNSVKCQPMVKNGKSGMVTPSTLNKLYFWKMHIRSQFTK